MADRNLAMARVGNVLSPLLLTGGALATAVGVDWNINLTWYDQHRIGQVALLVLTTFSALAALIRNADIHSLLSPATRVVLLAAFGWGAVSVLLAAFPRFAALEWATLVLLLTLALLLAAQAVAAAPEFDAWAGRILLALAVLIALKVMTAYVAAVVEVKRLDTLMLFEGTFSNRRFFGQTATILVPLLAYPLVRKDLSRSARNALFSLLAGWWMLVIVSGTRGTWMGLAVAATVLAFFAWRASAGWLKIQALAFGTGALMFAMFFVCLPLWLGLDASLENRFINPTTLSGREALWSLAWAQIQAHPWFGVGPMHLAAIRNDFGAHPHNAALQLAAEWGLPAALALVLPVAAGMLRLVARLRENEAAPNVLLVCLTGSLLAAGAQSMVDGVIVIPYTQTLLVLVAGWALGAYFRDAVSGQVASGSDWAARQGIFLLQAVALAALLRGVFPEVLSRGEITEAYVAAGNPLPLPRYWAVGWIP